MKHNNQNRHWLPQRYFYASQTALAFFFLVLIVLGCSQQEGTGSKDRAEVKSISVEPEIATTPKQTTSTQSKSEKTSETFNTPTTVSEPTKRLPRMVDLGADKCIPCKTMAPFLEELRVEYEGKVDVVFIDVWKNPEPGREARIRVIPTQIFYDTTGTEVFRHEGFYSKADILSKWRELGFELD